MFTYTAFNTLEGLFWIILAIVCMMAACRKKGYRKVGALAAATFFLFGISDFVEIQTGGFIGHSTWLLVWKILCVVGIVISIVWYVLTRIAVSKTAHVDVNK